MAVKIGVAELPKLGLERHAYVDAEYHALELDRFWRPGWRFVCTSRRSRPAGSTSATTSPATA